MKKTTRNCILAAAFALGLSQGAHAQAYTQNFDDISTLSGSGWVQQNNSSPVGVNPVWFQGTSVAAGGPFDAYNGAANAYIACNFNSTAGGSGTISNWLVTPNRTFRNGDVFTFYTRKDAPDTYYDRMEVRMSTNGASTNVGTGATATGDFTTLLLSINPTLIGGVYPTTWTLYTITISGLSAPTSGRIAFRYYVTGAGPSGTYSDYIGVDNVVYTPYVCPALSVTPTSVPDATAGSAYSQSLSQTGALGTPSYAVTTGSLPSGMTLSSSGVLSGTPTVTGSFNFTVSVSDASGCAGSTAYTLSVACPNYTFGGAYGAGTAGVAYSQAPSVSGGIAPVTYSATGSLPPGLSMAAGTGTVSGTPTGTGTYSFTLNTTDANGCTGAASYSITINCPTNGASLTLPQTVFCANAGIATISGGSPAGGVYSGDGVSGTDFDPATGSQQIQYTLVDPYGCTQTAMDSVTVNPAPNVTASASPLNVCEGSDVTLSGSGADTYTWDNGVTDGVAFPATASTTVYTVTGTVAATGCSSTESVTITVNPVPNVGASTSIGSTSFCQGTTLALMGTGADTYTWDNGVFDGVDFTPDTSATYTVTGIVTSTGCSSTASVFLNVIAAPVADLSAISPTMVCANSGQVQLTGGSPAGGFYSGSNISSSSGTFETDLALPQGYLITYQVFDTVTGCSGQDTATIYVSTCTGIETHTMSENVSVYPNPSSGAFTVVYDNASHANLVIRITDIQGKAVAAEAVNDFTGTYTNTFDLSNFGKGMYLLEISDKGQVVHKKIVVQ